MLDYPVNQTLIETRIVWWIRYKDLLNHQATKISRWISICTLCSIRIATEIIIVIAFKILSMSKIYSTNSCSSRTSAQSYNMSSHRLESWVSVSDSGLQRRSSHVKWKPHKWWSPVVMVGNYQSINKIMWWTWRIRRGLSARISKVSAKERRLLKMQFQKRKAFMRQQDTLWPKLRKLTLSGIPRQLALCLTQSLISR